MDTINTVLTDTLSQYDLTISNNLFTVPLS